jgi:8-amino-7-oxononanoate synthase
LDLFEKCRRFTRPQELQQIGLYPYFHPISGSRATRVVIDGREMIMVGSNNYLGLTHHPAVIEASIRAVEKYGTGCTGSRFLNGTLDLHEELETRLARFMGREACLTFTTGYQTNLGTIDTLVGKDDLIFCDRENHASIFDGCRMSFGETRKFRHNDMRDLERLLEANREPGRGKLVVVDGVFSMGGDLANLPALVELKDRHGARLLVDEAHSLGVLGEGGRGAAEHFGLSDRVDVVMGTFSKSFASAGGFIVAEAAVINYVKHFSRPEIFSAAMPPAAVATVIAALEVLEKEPELRERLWTNARRMKRAFDEMGFDTGQSETPVIPILIGDQTKTFLFWRRLFDAGVFANPVTSPAVPPGKDLIRTSYMAIHTDEELDQVLEVFEQLGREFDIIPKSRVV